MKQIRNSKAITVAATVMLAAIFSFNVYGQDRREKPSQSKERSSKTESYEKKSNCNDNHYESKAYAYNSKAIKHNDHHQYGHAKEVKPIIIYHQAPVVQHHVFTPPVHAPFYRSISRHADFVVLDGIGYYFYKGKFYRPAHNGYYIVNPPVLVRALPEGCNRIWVNGQPRYFYRGIQFALTPQGFRIHI